jgi:hypothetical protein
MTSTRGMIQEKERERSQMTGEATFRTRFSFMYIFQIYNIKKRFVVRGL